MHARRVLAPVEDMLKASKRLFTPSFLEAIQRSHSATAELGNMIDRLRIKVPDVSGTAAAAAALDRIKSSDIYRPELRVPELANFRSPLLDTNEKLSDVVNKLETMEGLTLQMAETVKRARDAVSQFIVDFGVATERADRSSRRAIWIALVAIAVAVLSTIVQIGYSERRTQLEQAGTVTAINQNSTRIEANAEAQRESMEGIRTELSNGNSAIKTNLDRLSITLQTLTEILETQKDAAQSSGPDGRPVPAE